MRVALCALVAACLAVAEAQAQSPVATDATTPQVTASVRAVTRVESWSFFDPAPLRSLEDGADAAMPPATDPDYTFLGNRFTLGVHASSRRWEALGVLQYIQLWNLPSNAFGPGAFGTGAHYYLAANQSRAYQLYPRLLSVTWKDALSGTSIRGGRMEYSSGVEASSGVPSLEFLKRERLDGRLIGPFEWSIVQRAFDGVRADVDKRGWHATAAFMMPTQGTFEESATPTITDIQVAAGSVSLRPHVLIPWSELQGFANVYRDRRPVAVRPDNTGRVGERADVTVSTVGASQAGIFPTVAGEADSIVWVAGQLGDWYGERHRAFSVAAEIGHRFTAMDWQPWIRAGWLYASGDGDPSDDRHGTFFQMLPTMRRYAQTATYALMNLRDLFVQGYLKPHARLTLRTDLHRIDLASGNDPWYSGSGATAREGIGFGFSTRPSAGETGLGTVLEASADVRLHRRWSVNGFIGTMWGGDVVRRLFAGDRLTFAYVENVVRF
ncbi:MAG: alginate export family protein [Acidobacteria bacterium]|nr:alginate export family protein [Acidobacteriota bacterium]